MTKIELIDAVQHAARAQSTATVFFHHAIAQRFGLGATDTKAIDVIVRLGPLTASQLAEHTALAPASVTSLIDRLEKKGLVRRMRDREDRRRVLVKPDHQRLGEMAAFFDKLRPKAADLFRPYTVAQLKVIHDYLHRSTAWLQTLTEAIQVGDEK